jgi:hypothetical protein
MRRYPEVLQMKELYQQSAKVVRHLTEEGYDEVWFARYNEPLIALRKLTDQEVKEYKNAQDKEKKLEKIAEDLSEEELLALLEKKKSQKK